MKMEILLIHELLLVEESLMPPSAKRLRRSGSSKQIARVLAEDFEHPLFRRRRVDLLKRAAGKAGLDEVERIDAALDRGQNARGVAGVGFLEDGGKHAVDRLIGDDRGNLGGELLRTRLTGCVAEFAEHQRQRPVGGPAFHGDVDVVAGLRQGMIERVVGGDLLTAGAAGAVELRKSNVATAVDHAGQAGIHHGLVAS